MKHGPASSGAFLAVILLGGCASSSQVADLAANPEIYRELGFVTKLPGDREVFVAPVQDARHPEVLPASQNGLPITYDSDERWARPVRDMVDDVLRSEIANSRLFAGVLDQAAPGALVILPALVNFETAVIEQEMGAKSIAEVGLRVRVFGPQPETGERPVLHDQVYADRELSTTSMVPPSTYLMAGRALRICMQRTIAGLDGANLGRTGIPGASSGQPAPAK